MRIRDAVEADLGQLAAYLVETQQLHAEAYPDTYAVIGLEEASDHLRPQLTLEHYYHRVAEESGRTLGCCFSELRRTQRTLFHLPRTILYLAQITVNRGRRRQGIGKALLEDLRRIAAREGAQRIELDVWQFNVKAQQFFTDQGFRAFGQRLYREV